MVQFYVIENLIVDVLLGFDFMERTGLQIDCAARVIRFKFAEEVAFPYNAGPSLDSLAFFQAGNEAAVPRDYLEQLNSLKEEFSDVLTPVLGCLRNGTYEIELSDHTPVRSPPYQCSPPRLKALRGIVNDLLAKGVIRRSVSDYASPAFLVPKRSPEQYRMVIDYKKLNDKIIFDTFPLPTVENTFLHFQGARFFSVLDLNSAYYQLPLSKASSRVAAFITPFGLFEPCRTPMGLSVGAQVLSRVLDNILGDIKYEYVCPYLDDVLVFSRSFQSHLLHLREVFSRLRAAGLTLNPDKAALCVPEIKFLGHLISASGVRVNPEPVKAIVEYPEPSNLKGIRKFLGMVGFFGRYIPEFSRVAAPLNDLKKKGRMFVWGEEQKEAFCALKKALSQPPTLQFPDFSKEFFLYTDASNVAVAAVLKQRVGDGLAPIAFASRVLSRAEQVYSTYEKECLAVLFGCERFRQLLEHKEFTVCTDNQALSWMRGHVRQLGRIGRWILRLSPFKFKVVHVRGHDNPVADALTRVFEETPTETSSSDLIGVILPEVPASFLSIEKHQADDELCHDIKSKLETGVEVKDFRLVRGLVVFRPPRCSVNRIVLPRVLIPMIMAYFHDSPLGGHLGQRKTFHKIARQFYWRAMSKDIFQYVRRCAECQRTKASLNQNLGLHSARICERPGDCMFIDFFGPLVRSKSRNSAILSVIDGFSKFVWLFPIRQMTAQITVELLSKRLFAMFGVPRTLVSDNGTPFRSKLFRDMCFRWGVKHVRTAPYHPSPNHVERFHRNLKTALQIYHHDNQSSWDANLHLLTLGFNTATHESTGSTPSLLFLGRDLLHPLELQWDLSESLREGVAVQSLELTWEKALSSLKKARDKVAKRYDVGRLPVPFKLGDVVLCRVFPQSSAAQGFSAKLARKWSEPLVVAKFVSPVTVLLADPSTSVVKRTAHVHHVKKYHK